MVHRYYRYDDMGALAPKFPGSFDSGMQKKRGMQEKKEEIREEKREEKQENKKQTGFSLPMSSLSGIFKGESRFDDMLLIFLIVMLMRSEEKDIPLILALGYIFMSGDSDDT